MIEKKDKIISTLSILTCGFCRSFKPLIRKIEYFESGQVRLRTTCDCCGNRGFFLLYGEDFLPQIETRIKPEKDVRKILLEKVQDKRLREIKKKEKVRQVPPLH